MRSSRYDVADVVRRYEAGESAPAIARALGCGEANIRGLLYRRGVTMRTPQDYPVHVTAAHAARRGQRDPMTARIARANTRERRGLGTSAREDELAEGFDVAGFVGYVRQKAVGPYNLDFAFPSLMIGVEVSGGGHNPRVVRNGPVRAAYLADAGWTVQTFRTKDRKWIANALLFVALHMGRENSLAVGMF